MIRTLHKFPRIEYNLWASLINHDKLYLEKAFDAHNKEITDCRAIYIKDEQSFSSVEISDLFFRYEKIWKDFDEEAQKIVQDIPYIISVGCYTVYYWYKHQYRKEEEIPVGEEFNEQVFSTIEEKIKYLMKVQGRTFKLIAEKLGNPPEERIAPIKIKSKRNYQKPKSKAISSLGNVKKSLEVKLQEKEVTTNPLSSQVLVKKRKRKNKFENAEKITFKLFE